MEGLPLTLTLPARRTAQTQYRYTPLQRGDVRFAGCDVRITGPLGLWEHQRFFDQVSNVRVYPNFAAVMRYTLLATDNRLSQIGIMQRQRRGEGLDFHQLREYREGDTQRQIDWNATARARKMISREYRDERDQQIMFLIDCGRPTAQLYEHLLRRGVIVRPMAAWGLPGCLRVSVARETEMSRVIEALNDVLAA